MRRTLIRLQSQLAHALGVDPGGRSGIVGAMLASNVRRAPGYWLQLFLATGIAALGLVLGSTAVVIGGMLVSPLMGPLIELGMGFAVGSSLLVLQAFLRVTLSVIGVVAIATGVTLMLPFHEITAEIASRTAPTLLDLLIAVFCALTAAYTTVRQTADTTAAAAGTAIGIALVPPLCVVGFGLGTADPRIAGGAALLFTANFSAILVFAVLTFLLLGFSRVDATAMEHEFLETPRTRTELLAQRMHRFLREAFGSRYGMAMRMLVPGTFLLAVYIPLSRALDEVGWEVRTRDAVRRIVAQESPRAVQTAVTAERGAVSLRLLIVGSPERATELEQQLAARIAAASGVVPTVTVTAVPDAKALATLSSSVARSRPPEPVPVDLRETTARIRTGLSAAWPSGGGRLVGWTLQLGPGSAPQVTVRHLGPALGLAGEQMLGQRLSEAVGTPVRVVGAALPVVPISADSGASDDSLWVRRALDVLAEVAHAPDMVACVAGPIGTGRRVSPGSARVLAVLENTAVGRAGRLTMVSAPRWSLWTAATTCAAADSGGAPTP